MTDYVFACLATPGDGMTEARLLARSIRQFGGSMAGKLMSRLMAGYWSFYENM